jgi:ATP-dependent Clp protease ATP-binding subunit ClpA
MIAEPKRILDLKKRSPTAEALVQMFNKRVVGQPEATQVMADIVETFQAGLCDPRRPAGNALFLGPTGTGKTHVVESLCEALFGNVRACLKVNAAEFVHSHEVAKLVGSPPGYL